MNVCRKYERELLFAAVALTFFVLYPLINHFSMSRDAHVLYTYYDSILPFVPAFIIPYMSGFVMPMLLYVLIKNRIFFRKAALSYMITFGIAYATYFAYPVKVVIRPESINSIFASVFQWYYPVDLPYNAFPSLHVAQPVLAALLAYHYDKQYWWMLLWAAVIALSTILVKQHYLADVAAGFVLAVGVYFLFVTFFNK
jgi:membrane-associated phospholipid phosphatase